jgi:hypothetical protein
MALPIIRAHICTLPIPIFPPLNSAPRTTTFGSGPPHPKTKRSCLHNGRKKLYHSQSATASNLTTESRTPEWPCSTSSSQTEDPTTPSWILPESDVTSLFELLLSGYYSYFTSSQIVRVLLGFAWLSLLLLTVCPYCNSFLQQYYPLLLSYTYLLSNTIPSRGRSVWHLINVYPCVPKNPTCRNDFMVWGS